MGYIVSTQFPKVLQEQKVEAISPHECYQRSSRKIGQSSKTMPAFLGFGACFIGSKSGTRWIGVKSNFELYSKKW